MLIEVYFLGFGQNIFKKMALVIFHCEHINVRTQKQVVVYELRNREAG